MNGMYAEKRTKTGAIVSGIVALLAVAGLTMAFLNTASPYVTMAEARQTAGDSLHLAGDMVKGSVRSDLSQNKVVFVIKDTDGTPVEVVYDGPAPSNLSEATRVVAIGKVQGNTFQANRLLVKCPTKYRGQQKA
jgi:cytochrome c-type biogenesis protein CcmE